MANVVCSNCEKEFSDQATACPQCGHQNKVNRGSGCFTTSLMLIIIMVGAGMMVGMLSTEKTTASKVSTPVATRQKTPAALEKEEILKSLSIKKISWQKSGLGNVMMMDVTIGNNGLKGARDVKITCVSSAKSGTAIDTNTKTIYDTFPAMDEKKIEDFNMGFINQQAVRTECRIVDAFPSL